MYIVKNVQNKFNLKGLDILSCFPYFYLEYINLSSLYTFLIYILTKIIWTITSVPFDLMERKLGSWKNNFIVYNFSYVHGSCCCSGCFLVAMFFFLVQSTETSLKLKLWAEKRCFAILVFFLFHFFLEKGYTWSVAMQNFIGSFVGKDRKIF